MEIIIDCHYCIYGKCDNVLSPCECCKDEESRHIEDTEKEANACEDYKHCIYLML